MARQNNRNPEREIKAEGQKRDAASNATRFPMNREPRYGERERNDRTINLNRYYLNDLYERSSI
ncbi:MAG: hypothetical protein ACJ75B_18795 [Flavisolibacter sp.]